MQARFFILLCVGVLAMAIANHDGAVLKVTDYRVKPEVEQTPEPKRVIVKQVVEIPKPIEKPDGYMTESQCYRVALGTDFRDLIWQYGWPAGDDGTDSYAGYLLYPLKEDHDRYCVIDTFGGEVKNKRVDIP